LVPPGCRCGRARIWTGCAMFGQGREGGRLSAVCCFVFGSALLA
jgi:hypothetical protein